MSQKIEQLLRDALAAAIDADELPAFELDDYALERPADTSHGEWTTTLAMKSAKLAHCAPRKIAEAIVAHLPEDASVEKVESAGPGFINCGSHAYRPWPLGSPWRLPVPRYGACRL